MNLSCRHLSLPQALGRRPVWRLAIIVGAVLTAAACSWPNSSGISNGDGPNDSASVKVIDGLIYGTAIDSTGDEVDLMLDVILLPADDEARPTVVFVHGGSFAFGSRNEYRSEARSWAEAGWVAVSVDYRLQPSEEAGRQPIAAAQAVNDVGDALRWLVENAQEYGIDTDRIVAIGGSAGGFTVLSPWLGPAPPELEVEPFPMVAAVVSNGATLEGARPAIGLAERGPPVLLIQHETDAAAGETIEDGRRTCDAIIAAEGVCETIALPGEGHLVSLHHDGLYGPDIMAFLTANLDL